MPPPAAGALMLDGSPGGSMTAGGSSSSSKHGRGHHGHVHPGGQKMKLTPSEVIAHHQNKTSGITNGGMQQTMQPGGPDATGIKIVQFLNMGLYTHHEGSRVPVGEPLFRPNPPRVEFSEYRALRLERATDANGKAQNTSEIRPGIRHAFRL
eukprot:g8241.t1